MIDPRPSPAQGGAAAIRVALIDRSSARIPLTQLEAVASALQEQLDRDLTPVWGVRATVAASRGQAPDGGAWWPILLLDTWPKAGGIHLSDRGGPYAEVSLRDDWTRRASHELMEMLVDPLGRRMQPGPSIDPVSGGRQVRYLVECADPVQSWDYEIKGVTVSDFVYPAYFGITGGGPPFDALGRLGRHLEVPPGGSLTWWDPADGRWHEAGWGDRFFTGVWRPPGVSAREARDQALGYRRARG